MKKSIKLNCLLDILMAMVVSFVLMGCGGQGEAGFYASPTIVEEKQEDSVEVPNEPPLQSVSPIVKSETASPSETSTYASITSLCRRHRNSYMSDALNEGRDLVFHLLYKGHIVLYNCTVGKKYVKEILEIRSLKPLYEACPDTGKHLEKADYFRLGVPDGDEFRNITTYWRRPIEEFLTGPSLYLYRLGRAEMTSENCDNR